MAKRKRSELKKGNTYFDGISTSHIYARFRNGAFIDDDTDEAVNLKEDTYVRITVSNTRIPKYLVPYHIESEPWTVEAGKQFYFDMPIDGEMCRFIVATENPILFKQDGHKPAKIIISGCTVIAKQDIFGKSTSEFKPIPAKSFNEAFRLTSIQYRSGKSSHACNIYREFRDVKEKRTLDDWREFKQPEKKQENSN